MTTTPETIFDPTAYGRIKGGVTAVATEIPLYPGDVQLFLQAWDSTKEFYATITNALNDIEIVKVTDIGRNKFTVERGQDDTTAQEWEDGAIINQRLNASLIDDCIQKETARQVVYNPNGILTPAYKFEKVFQSGPSDCEKRWFKNTSGTKWRLVAGAACPDLSEYFDDGYLVTPPATSYEFDYKDKDDQGGEAVGVYGDGNFIYLANYGRGIDVYTVSESGQLTWVSNNSDGANCAGVYSDGSFIYSASPDGLHSYSVNEAGALTHIDNQGLASQGGSITGDGRFIYHAISGKIEAYTVDEAGLLTLVTTYDPSGDIGAIHSMRDLYASSNYLFVGIRNNFYDGSIHSFSVSEAGVFTLIDSENVESDIPNNIWSDGDYLYATWTVHLRCYSIGVAGSITLTDSDTQGGGMLVALCSDGRFIFTSRYGSKMEAYTNDEGTLVHIDSSDKQGSHLGQDCYCDDNNFILFANSNDGIYCLKMEIPG